MKKILVTGASGFVGTYFVNNSPDYEIRVADLLHTIPSAVDFTGIQTVLHLAGLAHQKREVSDDEYIRINSDLAFNVANLARTAGVKQFIYISTVKVYGEYSEAGIPFTENSACKPCDGYGRSKIDAERRLREIENEEFRVALVRSSMVYGPGVRANMLNLIKLVSNFRILPLGNISNKRSMVYVGNLTALITAIIESTKGGLFLASDAIPVSTTELVNEISSCMGRKLILITLPLFMQKLLLRVFPSIAGRLLNSFELDCSYTNRQLSFIPPYSLQAGIAQTIRWYNEVSI